jgi:hypothetical protein
LSLLVLPVVQEFDGDQRLLLALLVDASALLNILLLLCKKCCSPPLQFAAAAADDDDDDAIIVVFLGVKSLLSFRVHHLLSRYKRRVHFLSIFL